MHSVSILLTRKSEARILNVWTMNKLNIWGCKSVYPNWNIIENMHVLKRYMVTHKFTIFVTLHVCVCVGCVLYIWKVLRKEFKCDTLCREKLIWRRNWKLFFASQVPHQKKLMFLRESSEASQDAIGHQISSHIS